MSVLVTGGTGYIGSHTVVELINAGYNVIIVDNLFNSTIDVIDKIETITGTRVKFYEIDLCDKSKTESIFKENSIDSVIHFAGYKAVGESVDKPLMYFQNNLVTTMNILELMDKYHVEQFVFSSSATVYGNPEVLPLTEDSPLSVTNPYGRTKLMIEQILGDLAASKPNMKISILRYFNPIGAHKSGLIGENPNGIPNNLIPYISRVATGQYDKVNVFGDDYDTPDGTGVRDYIHVVDLALGHIKALEFLQNNKGIHYHNLGTGKGYSVLDIINTYKEVSNNEIMYEIAPRRSGDIASCYSDPSKAKYELNWVAATDLKDMLEDTWNFVKKQYK